MWDAGEVDVLLWISADSRDAVVSAYAEAGDEIFGHDSPQPARMALRLLAWFGETDLHWLVVLDGLQQPGDLAGLWPPHTSTGQVVVTTRRRDAALAGGDRTQIEVDMFTPTESAGYLKAALAGHIALLDGAQELAADVGHLPVALAQVAAYLLDRSLTCSSYRVRLLDRRRTLVDVFPTRSELPDDQRATISAIWSLSIDLADRLPPAGLARPVLEVVAALDCNGIPGALFSVPAAAGQVAGLVGRAVTEDDLHDALRVLHRLNLITVDATEPGRTVRVHHLVQRTTWESLTSERQAQVAGVVGDSLVEVWPKCAQADRLVQVLRANAEALHYTAGLQLWSPTAHPVLLQLGESLGRAGLLSSAVSHYRHLLTTAQQYLAPDTPQVLSIRGSLATWLGEAGDVAAAVTMTKDLLNDRTRMLGPDHPDTLNTRRHLAHWCGQAGAAAEAVAILEAVLKHQDCVLGPDHHDTMTTCHFLGHWRFAVGDWRGAVTVLERIEQAEKELGETTERNLAAAALLAMVRLRPERGIVNMTGTYEELTSAYKDRFGEVGPGTLKWKIGVAVLNEVSGSPECGLRELDKIIYEHRGVLDNDHPVLLSARSALGRLQVTTGSISEGIATLEEVVVKQAQTLGWEHSDTLSSRLELVGQRGCLDSKDQNPESLHEVISDSIDFLGESNPVTLWLREESAKWQGQWGDQVGALATLEAVLADRIRFIGRYNAKTLAAHANVLLKKDELGIPVSDVEVDMLIDDVEYVFGIGIDKLLG
ncbi:tetratricopeptide repeat protein [Amycolatopsis sp. w19]|uniref:tetratricopeptide repeat protein n=1 Tax=Amycolatopsis sp. w19 TaxID=3448134 RepID=UPI003F1A8BD8